MYGLYIGGELIATYDSYEDAMLDAFEDAKSEGWDEIEVVELDGDEGGDD